jgi:hypothetical protein
MRRSCKIEDTNNSRLLHRLSHLKLLTTINWMDFSVQLIVVR